MVLFLYFITITTSLPDTVTFNILDCPGAFRNIQLQDIFSASRKISVFNENRSLSGCQQLSYAHCIFLTTLDLMTYLDFFVCFTFKILILPLHADDWLQALHIKTPQFCFLRSSGLGELQESRLNWHIHCGAPPERQQVTKEQWLQDSSRELLRKWKNKEVFPAT